MVAVFVAVLGVEGHSIFGVINLWVMSLVPWHSQDDQMEE